MLDTYHLPENANIDDILADIQAVCVAAEEVLGSAYTPEELISYVQDYLGCPLIVCYAAIPADLEASGLCAKLRDGVLIVIQEGLDQILEFQTLGHEGAHLLSNHVREAPFTIADIIDSPSKFIDYALLRRTDSINDGFDTEYQIKEYIAEEIGMKLAEGIIRKTSLLPEFAKNLFGGEE